MDYTFLDTEDLKMYYDLKYIPVCNFNFDMLPVRVIKDKGKYRYFLKPFITFEEINSVCSKNNSDAILVYKFKNKELSLTSINEVRLYEELFYEELETFYDFYTNIRINNLKTSKILTKK